MRYALCTARQLINRHDPKTLLADKTVLVIDALDEVSAQKDGDAVDLVLRKLGEIGYPPFILSCRVTDWRSATGIAAINEQYDSSPLEAHLKPLVIIDKIDESTAELIVRLVRAANDIGSSTRFLLIPNTSLLRSNLSSVLVGCAQQIELSPFHPLELFSLDAQSIPSSPGSYEPGTEAEPLERHIWSQEKHWLRGGLPESFNAIDDETSFNWRRSYCQNLLGGDLDTWGVEPSDQPDQIINYLVLNHGQPFSTESCCSKIGVNKKSVNTVIYRLTQLGLIRSLYNFADGKGVVHLVRDSGVFHALYGVRSLEQLRLDGGMLGHSWEGFATEALMLAFNGKAILVIPAILTTQVNTLQPLFKSASGSVIAVLRTRIPMPRKDPWHRGAS